MSATQTIQPNGPCDNHRISIAGNRSSVTVGWTTFIIGLFVSPFSFPARGCSSRYYCRSIGMGVFFRRGQKLEQTTTKRRGNAAATTASEAEVARGGVRCKQANIQTSKQEPSKQTKQQQQQQQQQQASTQTNNSNNIQQTSTQSKLNQTKPNQTKPNQTKPNPTKPNQNHTKPKPNQNQTHTQTQTKTNPPPLTALGASVPPGADTGSESSLSFLSDASD